MNTYDAAYDLVKAIKESDEMKRLTAAADKVKNDADAKISPGIYSMESGGCGFAEDRLGCNGAGYGCIGIR